VPENIGDFDRLVSYYQEDILWYSKLFEVVTKFYFTQIPNQVMSAELFKVLTVLLCYLPLVHLVEKCRNRNNQLISLILLCVCIDAGHTLQFARTYLVLNILVLVLFYYQRRFWIGISTITIHQGIGFIYLFYSIIRVARIYSLLILLALISTINLYLNMNIGTIISALEFLKHSLWIFDSVEYYGQLNMLLLPKLISVLACQCIFVLVAWEIISVSVLTTLVICILFIVFGLFGEIIFRINCYILEVIFPLQFVLIKKRLKFAS
jgi:hypothetical protein